MLKQRIITGIILLLLMCGMLFWASSDVWAGFSGVITLLILWEYARMQKIAHTSLKIYLLLSTIIGLWLFLSVHQFPWYLHLAVLVFWLIVAPLLLKFRPHIQNPLYHCLLGWLMFIPFWQAMIQLRDAPQTGVIELLLFMALVWVADIGAYVFGRLLGKHKLAPNISPGKSWEGALGGVVCVLIYLCLVRQWLPSALADWLILLPMGVVLTAISIEGDLLESLFKRQAQIKDSSQLLPGHGGVYDRTDSLIAVLSVLVACKTLISLYPY